MCKAFQNMESNTWEAVAALRWKYFTVTEEFWHLADAAIGVFNSKLPRVQDLLLGFLTIEDVWKYRFK